MFKRVMVAVVGLPLLIAILGCAPDWATMVLTAGMCAIGAWELMHAAAGEKGRPLIPLAVICVYPLIFAQFGEVYLPTSYGSIFAFFVMGAALMAVGVFLSSLTENQGFAAGITIAVILFNYYSVSLSEYISSTAFGSLIALDVLAILLGFLIRYLTRNEGLAYGVALALVLALAAAFLVDSSLFEGLLPAVMEQLSLFERFNTFVNGVFDVTAIVYYLSVIGFFLLLSVQSMEKRRYN